MRFRQFLPATLLFLGLSAIARADITYTYTGNPFNYFDGDLYKPGDSIQGSFTFAGPATRPGIDPGTTLYYDTDLTDFKVTDGVFTYTPANTEPDTPDGGSSLLLEVDPHGNVVYWSFFIESSSTGSLYDAVSRNRDPEPGFSTDFGEAYIFQGGVEYVPYGEIDDDPGTWTHTTTSAAPEPSSLALLGTGALAVAGVLRRRSGGIAAPQAGGARCRRRS